MSDQEEEDFAAMFEASVKARRFAQGQTIEGTIVAFGPEVAFVSVGGTVARARLVPAADVPQLADQWNTRSLSIGGGFGSFGANIVGRVVNVPGESNVWKGLGLGLTWRTPWSGQLSVGADNVVTRGKNPFSTINQDDEGTVPYVRYQQDL